MARRRQPGDQARTPFWVGRLLAGALLLGILVVNIVTDDHPIRQTVVGLSGGALVVAFGEMQRRRTARGKAPLEMPTLSEEWSLRVTVGLAVLAAVAICAFAIGAILHD